MSPADSGVLLGASSDALFRSTDAGESWTQVDSGAIRVGPITALAFDPKNAQRAYAVGGDFAFSGDGGVTWTRQSTTASTPCALPFAVAVAFDATSPDRMYAASDKGIAVSDDAGACWTAGVPHAQRAACLLSARRR